MEMREVSRLFTDDRWAGLAGVLPYVSRPWRSEDRQHSGKEHKIGHFRYYLLTMLTLTAWEAGLIAVQHHRPSCVVTHVYKCNHTFSTYSKC